MRPLIAAIVVGLAIGAASEAARGRFPLGGGNDEKRTGVTRKGDARERRRKCAGTTATCPMTTEELRGNDGKVRRHGGKRKRDG